MLVFKHKYFTTSFSIDYYVHRKCTLNHLIAKVHPKFIYTKRLICTLKGIHKGYINRFTVYIHDYTISIQDL